MPYSQEAEDAITRNTPPPFTHLCGEISMTELTLRVVPATYSQLMAFSFNELKNYARALGVRVDGRSKAGTALNLMQSGKATLCATLGD